MRLLVLLVAVALVVAVVLYVLRRRARADAAQPWHVAEVAHDGALELRALRPGQEPVLLDRVDLGAEDFELAVEEARARALSRVVALNSGG